MKPLRDDQQAFLQLFLGHLKAGRKNEANQVLARALKTEPSKAASYALLIGGLLAQNSQYEEAIPLYQEAIRLDPSEPTGYFHLGIAFHALKKQSDSEKIWDDLAQRFPGHALDHYQKGLRFSKNHWLNEAKHEFEQAQALLAPNNPMWEDLRKALHAIERQLSI